MTRIEHYIDGELVAPRSGKYIDNLEPATGAAYSTLADGDDADVARAVEAAQRAFPAWSRTPVEERSRILLSIADRIDADVDQLARAESIDTGKPLSLARSMDIPRAAANFRFFATAVVHTHSEAYATDDRALNYTLRRPRGVAGLISPWNLPLYLLSWKIAPAIAAGNTAVAKPSELTPMTAWLLASICRDAGLPRGVLNIVQGRGATAGAALVRHEQVPTLSFTGGTATGAAIAGAAAPMFKRVALELGGKNPNIIFADADLDEVIESSLASSFANQGQVCLCGSRIFVEQSVYERFVERFTAATSRLKLGDPLEPGTNQGALISAPHRDKVLGYIDLARREGGTILLGGGPPKRPVNDRCREGFFVEPTIITGLAPDARVNREEIFGPVVTIAPFRSEDEVVGWANGTDYGLTATLWTESLGRAHRLADRINAGTIWVNCWRLRDLRVPFGGTKRSGVGREGGEEALRFFTEPKTVCIRVPRDQKEG